MSQQLDGRLAALTKLCEQQRQASSPRRPMYNEGTKACVRELADSGVHPATLARTAGVSFSTIKSWLSDSQPAEPIERVKVLQVEGSGGAPEGRRAILTLQVSDYEVAVYARGQGRP